MMIQSDIACTFDWIPQTFDGLDPYTYLHRASSAMETKGAYLYIRDYGQWEKEKHGNECYIVHLLLWATSIEILSDCLAVLKDYPFQNFRTYKEKDFARYTPIAIQPPVTGPSTFAQEWVGQYNDAILFDLPILGTGSAVFKPLTISDLSTVFDLFEHWTYRAAYRPQSGPQPSREMLFFIATTAVKHWSEFKSQLAPFMDITKWEWIYLARELRDDLLGGNKTGNLLPFAREFSEDIFAAIKLAERGEPNDPPL